MMELIKEVDIMNNKKAVICLNLIAVPVVFLFMFLFGAIASKIQGNLMVDEISLNILRLMMGVLILFLILIIHELIHGLFFKLFNRKGKVKFGLKKGMAYATSLGSYYSKGCFVGVSLAPFVLISLLLFILLLLNALSPLEFVVLASVHAGGCVGDFYWVLLTLCSPKNSFIEDTEKGINFYQEISDTKGL